ncbi:hypothetical protein COU91_02400 [Candidatus Saccharibacteria bacterium CG10_big_fil_rev_8_21_14_0_10_47_8]|nr:MAG: hypothetical protein COU91_02400 [Candidatus Saccharibacteria bacterium CG10_big_fil_rev_8_21_14_0_10_47_8]
MEPDGAGGCAPHAINLPDDLWAIGLAIIDIMVRLAGIAVVFFIIYASISYIISQGNAEKTTAARKRITNSLIGLGVVLVASVFVAFIGNTIGK